MTFPTLSRVRTSRARPTSSKCRKTQRPSCNKSKNQLVNRISLLSPHYICCLVWQFGHGHSCSNYARSGSWLLQTKSHRLMNARFQNIWLRPSCICFDEMRNPYSRATFSLHWICQVLMLTWFSSELWTFDVSIILLLSQGQSKCSVWRWLSQSSKRRCY